MLFHSIELLIAYFIKIIDWLKNKMQQKILSDQPLRQVRQTKSRSNINDGFVRWGCVYGCCLLVASVRWLAAIPLLCHFCSCSFTLLPQALLLTDWKETA